MRFNEDYIVGYMRALDHNIVHLNENLKGGWFSAKVQVRRNKEVHMLTTKEGRRVSNILSRSQVDVF
jgi:hypothetical protein